MSRKYARPLTLGSIVQIYGFDTLELEELPNARPTAEMLADRDRRYYGSSRSITSQLMGDPPPGQSALDRARSNN